MKPAHLSNTKRIVFTSASVFLCLSFLILTGELLLRIKKETIRNSDHMDPGLIQYHPHLGWKLTPNWGGRHRHYDFDVHYTTNRYGFRDDAQFTSPTPGSLHAFVGDSFAFGLGVNDDETFVHQLGSLNGSTNVYHNFSVPGYSTDQELLLIKEQVLYFSPQAIWLVVYLGNDLFDNELAFPLQAENAKPYFELAGDELALRNSPVPLVTKPAAQQQRDLATLVMGDDHRDHGFFSKFLNWFELYRLLKVQLAVANDTAVPFDDGRFGYQLRLFRALMQQINEACEHHRVQFGLILMPGKSFVEDPQSTSAQFQGYLRAQILEAAGEASIQAIDLASALRERFEERPETYFYPNEGHLTPRGHRAVAEILAPSFQQAPELSDSEFVVH